MLSISKAQDFMHSALEQFMRKQNADADTLGSCKPRKWILRSIMFLGALGSASAHETTSPNTSTRRRLPADPLGEVTPLLDKPSDSDLGVRQEGFETLSGPLPQAEGETGTTPGLPQTKDVAGTTPGKPQAQNNASTPPEKPRGVTSTPPAKPLGANPSTPPAKPLGANPIQPEQPQRKDYPKSYRRTKLTYRDYIERLVKNHSRREVRQKDAYWKFCGLGFRSKKPWIVKVVDEALIHNIVPTYSHVIRRVRDISEIRYTMYEMLMNSIAEDGVSQELTKAQKFENKVVIMAWIRYMIHKFEFLSTIKDTLLHVSSLVGVESVDYLIKETVFWTTVYEMHNMEASKDKNHCKARMDLVALLACDNTSRKKILDSLSLEEDLRTERQKKKNPRGPGHELAKAKKRFSPAEFEKAISGAHAELAHQSDEPLGWEEYVRGLNNYSIIATKTQKTKYKRGYHSRGRSIDGLPEGQWVREEPATYEYTYELVSVLHKGTKKIEVDANGYIEDMVKVFRETMTNSTPSKVVYTYLTRNNQLKEKTTGIGGGAKPKKRIRKVWDSIESGLGFLRRKFSRASRRSDTATESMPLIPPQEDSGTSMVGINSTRDTSSHPGYSSRGIESNQENEPLLGGASGPSDI